MKRLGTLLFFPLFAFALQSNHILTQIEFSGEPVVAVKVIQNGFNAAGYRLEIHSLMTENGRGTLQGEAVGIRAFDPDVLRENLHEQGVAVEQSEERKGVFSLLLDAKNALWNLPQIGNDEGTELERTNVPQWFRVHSGQTIKIEPSYAGKWYPDVAVLDSSMKVLYSFRSEKAQEEWSFRLPEGACYLKVSNIWGMKVLREGTWIESISSGR